MILTILASVLVPYAASLGVVIYDLKHAVMGYEDDSGFHEGLPAHEKALVPVYNGPERRRRFGAPVAESLYESARYTGPLRRRNDDRISSHFGISEIGGMA